MLETERASLPRPTSTPLIDLLSSPDSSSSSAMECVPLTGSVDAGCKDISVGKMDEGFVRGDVLLVEVFVSEGLLVQP